MQTSTISGPSSQTGCFFFIFYFLITKLIQHSGNMPLFCCWHQIHNDCTSTKKTMKCITVNITYLVFVLFSLIMAQKGIHKSLHCFYLCFMQLSTVLESALYHQHVLNVSKVKALIVLKIGPTD